MIKEMISCAEQGPTPPEGFPDDSWYVGLFDDAGTILEQWFPSKQSAEAAYSRLDCEGRSA